MARRKSGGNDKYLRLTGLWLSKNNEMLFTGKLKAEQKDALRAKLDESDDNDAPLMFSLWENDKKKSRKDHDFSLQCFVGDSEESPRSRRGSRDRDEREEEEEAPRKKRKPVEEDSEEEPEEEPAEEEADEEEKPRKKGASTRKSSREREEEAPRGKSKKRESW